MDELVVLEWNDETWVTERKPQITYRWPGVDDAWRQMPDAWFDSGTDCVLAMM